MSSYHPQYIVDDTTRKVAVVLPIAEWDEILEALEELDDIQAYDAAKACSEGSISFDQAVRDLADDRMP